MDKRVVTVLGGSGFVGRYVVQALLATGARVRIAARDPRQAFFLRPQGGLGQVQFVAADVRRPATVARAIDGADAAVNLVGVMGSSMQAVNADGAATVADAVRAAGIDRFVHLSAIGADPDGRAVYARTKGAGEAAARTLVPTATILRPSVIFGREDAFINRFAGMMQMLPVVPVMGPQSRYQPVYVGDVADAVVAALADPGAHGGKTYDLGGPEVLTMRALNAWIGDATGNRRPLVDVPSAVGGLIARAGDWLPGAPINSDQWTMLQDGAVVAGTDGLAAMRIAPTPMAAVADAWLVRYRRRGRFDRRDAA